MKRVPKKKEHYVNNADFLAAIIKYKEKAVEMPTLDKDAIQKQVRSYLEKNPIIPFLFYGASLATLFGGLFYIGKLYKLI